MTLLQAEDAKKQLNAFLVKRLEGHPEFATFTIAFSGSSEGYLCLFVSFADGEYTATFKINELGGSVSVFCENATLNALLT